MLKHISYIMLMAFVTLGIASAIDGTGENRNPDECKWKAGQYRVEDKSVDALVDRKTASEAPVSTEAGEATGQ